MRKLLFWGTILSGAIAAYLLYKKGVPPEQILTDVISHPVKTLLYELGTPSKA